MFRKTRIAPTPSGFLHLGNIFSFAVTAGLARETGADLLLRIDDLDLQRTRPAYVQDIFDTLHFLEIPWQYGPADYNAYQQQYSQLHRLPLYRGLLEKLKTNGKAYACTCSRLAVQGRQGRGTPACTCRNQNLPLDLPGACWRLHTRQASTLTLQTWKNGTIACSLPPSMQDFVIRKKDGYPAYQLCSLADDLHFGIDLVVRGQDLWDSTLAQLCLARALEEPAFEKITFYHHPLVEISPGKKLSKSAGATSIQMLRKEGKTPVDIYHLIAAALGLQNQPGNWETLCRLSTGMP